jgi:hypothetical protein
MDYEDDGCLEYFEVMSNNPDNTRNQHIYDMLLKAIPNPKSKYCRWVIDQFLMQEFPLNSVEDVKKNLEEYISEINSELPDYYHEVEEELDQLYYGSEGEEDTEDEEEDTEDEEEIRVPKKLSEIIISKQKRINQQRS